MSRARKAPIEPDDDDDEDTEDPTNDYVMARLGAARAALQAAITGIDDMLGHFADPGDDNKGKERKEAMDVVIDMVGAGTRSLECAEESLGDCDFAAGEPWEDEAS